MDMINFGLVGCGRISDKHFEAIAQINNTRIVACADTLKERALAQQKKYNIKNAYQDYKQMILKEKLDVIIIATPSGIHPDIGIFAAKNGLHVVTEKPMAITLKKADELVKACDDAKVSLFVVKQNRLNTTMQLLKKSIEKKRFGKIYHVQSNVFWQRPQSYYNLAKWRGTWEFDGGAFMNQASHYVDALYWLCGEVQSVMAETSTMARLIEAEDTGSAILKFRNGAIGTLNVTMLSYPRNVEGSITILGEKGTVKIGGIAVNKIERWDFEEYDDDDRMVEDANYTPTNVYGFGHLGYYKNVVEALQGNSANKIDGRCGRKSLEIIRAIYLSAKTGKKIPLPLEY